LAGQQPLEVAVLLVLGAEACDDLSVAGVGCLRAEYDWRPGATPENLVDQRQLHRAEALPAQLGAQMRCPQALFADLLFEWVDYPAPLVGQGQELTAREQHLERFHLFADELADPIQLLLKLGFGRKVPRHPN